MKGKVSLCTPNVGFYIELFVRFIDIQHMCIFMHVCSVRGFIQEVHFISAIHIRGFSSSTVYEFQTQRNSCSDNTHVVDILSLMFTMFLSF